MSGRSENRFEVVAWVKMVLKDCQSVGPRWPGGPPGDSGDHGCSFRYSCSHSNVPSTYKTLSCIDCWQNIWFRAPCPMFLWQSVSVDQCDHGCSFRRQRCHPIHQFTESCIDFLDKASAFGSLSLSAQYSNISNIRIHTEVPRPALIASVKGRKGSEEKIWRK